MKGFLELAKQRHSTRKYQEKNVEREKIDLILEAARIAPSAHNYQAFKLIVVQQQAGLDKIAKAGNIYGAPLAIIVCEDKKSAWINPFNDRQLVSHDSIIATDHMMLEATELGLDSVWVCWFDPAIIKQEFNLPDNLEAINILAIGYGDKNAVSPAKKRKAIDEIVLTEF